MKKFYYNEEATINDLKVEEHENSKNIGRKIKFKNPTCSAEQETFYIVGIQKIWNGDYAYRVQKNDEDFGRPAQFDAIIFIDEE